MMGSIRIPIEVREDGVYVANFRKKTDHVRSSSDVMVETLVNWGVKWVWGMVGHSNLGFADAVRRQTQRRQVSATSGSDTKGAGAFCDVGVREAHRASCGLLCDRRSRRDQHADRAVGRARRSRSGPWR